MSVVAAKIYKDKIKICADSIVVYGFHKQNNGDITKLKKINNMIIGSVGTAEEISLMWTFAETHKPHSNSEKDMLNFLFEFKKYLNEFSVKQENQYLIIFDKKLFSVHGMLVHEVSDYCSIGAGWIEATTAMHLGHSPKKAVKVSCDLNCYVSEPILEMCVNLNKNK